MVGEEEYKTDMCKWSWTDDKSIVFCLSVTPSFPHPLSIL